MRYLNNREDFLKRTIDRINEFKNYEDIELINEAESGPFENDIPWGDSLVGRLINRIMRNAKKGTNLIRIKSVISKLKDAMDDILDGPASSKINSEYEKELQRLLTFSFIDNLEKAVKEGQELQIIINLAKTAIKEIEDYEDFEKKGYLINQLRDFLEFLESLKKEEDEKRPKSDSEGSEVKTAETLYPVMVKNIKSLGSILDAYKRVKLQSGKPKYSQVDRSLISYTTKSGDTINKIQRDVDINKKNLQAKDIRSKNVKVLQKYPKDNQTLPPGLVLIMENMISEGIPGTTTTRFGGSPDRGNIQANETHLSQAFTKLKKDIEILISPREKGIGIDDNFIKEITSKSFDTNNKNLIKELYIEINKYLVGDKKSTIQEKDPLYKENLEIITDKYKRIVVAEKIARFSKRALQFDGEGLYGGLGDLGKPLKDYVETIKQIMKMSPKDSTEEEVKKESKILKYSNFVWINEADEAKTPEEVGEPVVMTNTQKIQDYWNKKIDVKAFVMKKAEVIKMKQNFDKIESDSKKEGEKFWIYGIDPIIEIVKCFNRAYKLHTFRVIPNVGTSDGRVSASTFNQYTCFGDGNRKNAGLSGGPYRNNAIFNQWENAVLDILKETKYQKIFRKEVVIKTAEGNEIPNAGSNLRKFMTDMLAGDKLYMDKDLGQQAKFLDKYFGYTVENPEKLTIDDSDPKTNSTNASAASDKSIKFSKTPLKIESYEDLKGTFFAVTYKVNEQIRQNYFFVQEVQGNYAMISYCRSFYRFKEYLRKDNTFSIERGDIPTLNINATNKEGKAFLIKAFKVQISKIFDRNGNFLPNNKNCEIKHIIKTNNDVNGTSSIATDIDKFNVMMSYSLEMVDKNKNESKRMRIEKDIPDIVRSVGYGYSNIGNSKDIDKTEFKTL